MTGRTSRAHRGAEVGPETEREGLLRSGVLRGSLIVIIGMIGVAKFWPAEATSIQPLVSASPVVSWVYRIFTVRGFAMLLGSVELTIAFLLLLRPYSPRATMVGSAGGIIMFLTTLSFLFSSPGVWDPSGPPVLSLVGGFLVKDLALLGISIWSFFEARDGARVTKQEELGHLSAAHHAPA